MSMSSNHRDKGCPIPISDISKQQRSASSSAMMSMSSSALSRPAGQPDTNQDSKQVWKIDTGNNNNVKGKQKTGNVRAANSAAGSRPSINLPRSGGFVINTGGNTNQGDVQETGNVDFANIG